jgi:hypothetical protein
MDSYQETELRSRVDAALRRIRTVLDNTRNPQYPADVPHQYDDKYLLAEFLTRISVAAALQTLGSFGLTAEKLAQLREWARTRSVTLRLVAQEDCKFLREETRKVDSGQEIVTEKTGFLGGKTIKTEKVVTTITEYFWRFEFAYELTAYPGNAPEHGVPLLGRRGSVEIKTGARTTPRPATVVRPPVTADISWLLHQADDGARVAFTIDRTARTCHTPRRNRQIDEALRALDELHAWCTRVHAYFAADLFPAQQDHGLGLGAITAAEVFVPTVPLFEGERQRGAASVPGEGVLPLAFADAFLAEERRSLDEKFAELARAFPRNESVITFYDASLMVGVLHIRNICQHHANGVQYIEEMLRKQLIAAIGKELTPADFSAYMDFHCRKLLKPQYRPQPFSHAIRRPDHYPEGVLSIEADRGGPMPDPISTTAAWSAAGHPMSFALDAATRVTFLGDRVLHAWISHQFSGSSGLALSLVARARQFSSFVLLVGRIASADVFEPKYGIIVQNKDLLKIPLMLEQIPTPKEFRDAIESLSPEQQRFARAFRGMQLESTLFGVCVIQIKPQLEKLLKLDPDSLTKEIKLTQELLGLFIEYQIPSDLLSYDGPAEAPTLDKLARVKEYTERMLAMIDLSKQRELAQARERESYRLAEADRSPPPPPMYMPVPSAPMPWPCPRPARPMMAADRRRRPPRAAPRRRAPRRPMMPGSAPAPVMPSAPPPPPADARRAGAGEPRDHEADADRDRDADAGRRRQPRDRADGSTAAPRDGQAASGEPLDYTRIPRELDAKFEALDDDGALRPTILNPGDVWSRTAQKGLLAAPATATMTKDEQKDEKNRAFDLLDALSRSGALPIDHASLHVVIAATHCFDKTLLDTVIQGNVNPIEKVERSVMIVATTVHDRPASELLLDDQRARFFTYTRSSARPRATRRADAYRDARARSGRVHSALRESHDEPDRQRGDRDRERRHSEAGQRRPGAAAGRIVSPEPPAAQPRIVRTGRQRVEVIVGRIFLIRVHGWLLAGGAPEPCAGAPRIVSEQDSAGRGEADVDAALVSWWTGRRTSRRRTSGRSVRRGRRPRMASGRCTRWRASRWYGVLRAARPRVAASRLSAHRRADDGDAADRRSAGPAARSGFHALPAGGFACASKGLDRRREKAAVHVSDAAAAEARRADPLRLRRRRPRRHADVVADPRRRGGDARGSEVSRDRGGAGGPGRGPRRGRRRRRSRSPRRRAGGGGWRSRWSGGRGTARGGAAERRGADCRA